MIAQFAKYCLVGVVNTFVGLGLIFTCMAAFGLSPALSNLIGFAIGIVVSFSLNRIWTFASSAPIGKSFAGFAGICLVGYFLNLGVVLAVIYAWGVNPYIGQIAGVGCYAVFVFLGSRYFAFRR